MNASITWLAITIGIATNVAHADCVISEEAKRLDALEVGFCESDAVFVGRSEGAIETIGGLTDGETGKERHFRMQRSTVQVVAQYKSALPVQVKLVANLYDKQRAYALEAGKTYLFFAKRLAGENEFIATNATCSVQPTLPIEQAEKVLAQLEQHKQGRKPIDCAKIRAKQ